MKTILSILKLALFTLIAFFLISANSPKKRTYQQPSSRYEKGLKYEEENNYKEAWQTFSKLATDNDKISAELLYRIGVCQLNLTLADSAVFSLSMAERLIADKELTSDLSIDIFLTLAKSYQLVLNPNKAIEIYKRLLFIIKESDTELNKEIEDEIRACRNAQIYMDNPAEISIRNLGPNINTAANDHSPIVSLDENEIYYTSRQKNKDNAALKDGGNPEKIYHSIFSSKQWGKNYLLEIFFRNFENESALSISADGTELFLFRNDLEGQSIYESIYSGKKWGKPFKLPAPINSPANETHACLSPDKSTIFFTSDREGGLGGKDIYLARKNKEGVWGSLTNLGPNINTELDEETPIFHFDGKTLYFASEGHNSMGKMDVFYSQINSDSTWNEPVNLGYPINSPDDDFFFAPSITKDHAYYASSRQGQTYGGSDIYRVEFKKFLQGELAVIEGNIIPKNGENLAKGKIRIMVSLKSTNEAVANYTPDTNGKYMLFLETGQEYLVTQKEEGFEDVKTNISVSTNLAYKPDRKFVSFESLKIDAPLVEAKDTSHITTLNPMAPGENQSGLHSKAINVSPNAQIISDSTVIYTIQLLALKRRTKEFKNYFKGVKDFTIKKHRCIDGFTRFTIGSYNSIEEGQIVLDKLKELGLYKDAFVRNSERTGETHKH